MMTVATTERPIEGRVVRQGRPPPRTEYVYVQDQGAGQRQAGRRVSWNPGPYQRARVPSGLPSFLGNREIIFGSWAIAMALVTWDEWRTHGILARPLRLWETTAVYAILALVSIPDALTSLANAFAIGYTIVLLYQFFTGGGNFGGPGQ